MKTAEVMARLEAAGTAQNRKVYPRHGVGGPMFGVSFAELKKLTKAVGTDQEVAEELWATGNHDARMLATMVADPAKTTRKLLESWVKDVDNYVLADALSGLVAASPAARACLEKWTKARGEWPSTVGFGVLARRAQQDPEFEDGELAGHLEDIEQRIHESPNRTRYAMNTALICIGTRNAALERKALAAAKRIGTVEVDHGETSCRTPDAAAYIAKVRAHRSTKKGAKTAPRKKAVRKTSRKASHRVSPGTPRPRRKAASRRSRRPGRG